MLKTVMQDQNTIDQNKIFMGTLLAIGYNSALDADSDTIPLVMNIALMHPFYGGEAVYIARAMLHVNVEDILPPLRRKKATFGTLQNENLRIKIYPNPAKNIATIISNTEFENDTKLIFQNAMGSTIQTIELPINQKEYTIDINELADGIYFVKLSTAHGESKIEILEI